MIKTKDKQFLLKFGQIIRKLRLEQGLSQESLASSANVHRTYIGMIERGEKNITLLNIKKIAKALKVEMNQIFKEL